MVAADAGAEEKTMAVETSIVIKTLVANLASPGPQLICATYYQIIRGVPAGLTAPRNTEPQNLTKSSDLSVDSQIRCRASLLGCSA